MNLAWHRVDLSLRHLFRISRSAVATTPTVQVTFSHDGITGHGEASPSKRYGQSPESVESALAKLDLAAALADPYRLEDLDAYLIETIPAEPAARAAVEMAVTDWIGRSLGQPQWRLWGLDPGRAPVTSFTIAIDSPDAMAERVREADAYAVLKIKLGGPDDRGVIEAIRRVTDKPIRVDANEGWSREQAVREIEWLAGQGVEFVEQPLPAGDLDGTRWVHERSALPLYADENAGTSADLPALVGAFDGINIKLMKCGGLREALRMTHTARALGLKLMIGCMIESSVAITAAAQLTPLLDHADLDGNLLVTNDPYRGVTLDATGRLVLPTTPGLGVYPLAHHQPL